MGGNTLNASLPNRKRRYARTDHYPNRRRDKTIAKFTITVGFTQRILVSGEAETEELFRQKIIENFKDYPDFYLIGFPTEVKEGQK